MSRDIPARVTLGSMFRRHARAYVIGSIMLGAFQFAMNRVDWSAKATVDQIFFGSSEGAWKPAVAMLGLAVVAFFTRVASRWWIFNAGRDAEYELRRRLLERLHELGTAFYRRMSAGEIMSRSTNDLMQVRLLLGFGVLNVINVVFAAASALQVMITISGRLTLASMVSLPLLLMATRALAKRLYARTRDNQEALGAMSDALQRNLAGVRIVRSFGLEEREGRAFAERNASYLDASLALARLRGSMFPMMGAASAAGVLAFFAYGGSLLLRAPEGGGIGPGDFFAFSLSLARMTWPMIALGFALSMVQRGRAGFERLREIIESEPDVVDGPLQAPESLDAHVEVKGLSFAYDGNDVLRDVSLSVAPGESLAIVGRTGSGKSTLAALLARLLPTPRGTVFIGGYDSCDLPLAAVRTAIGYAQQDAFLFSTTVARNIGFALEDPDEGADRERVIRAATQAQVLGDAMALPDQLETVVGERGVQLSGGQKQRVALARALAWDPKILVLDDPMSAVDARTERKILDALMEHAQGRSLVLITHRVSAAACCDRVVVLDQGRVVDQGTHADLVARPGVYQMFAREQEAEKALATLSESTEFAVHAGDAQ